MRGPLSLRHSYSTLSLMVYTHSYGYARPSWQLGRDARTRTRARAVVRQSGSVGSPISLRVLLLARLYNTLEVPSRIEHLTDLSLLTLSR